MTIDAKILLRLQYVHQVANIWSTFLRGSPPVYILGPSQAIVKAWVEYMRGTQSNKSALEFGDISFRMMNQVNQGDVDTSRVGPMTLLCRS